MWDLAKLLAFKRVLDNVYTSSVSTVQDLESWTFLLSATIEVIYLFADIRELSLTCCSTSLHAGYDSATDREGVWHKWVLAKLTLGFLLSLGLTAVRATYSGPTSVAARAKERTRDSLLLCLSFVKKKKMVLLKMWNKVVATIFVGELLALSFWLSGKIKYTICKYSAQETVIKKYTVPLVIKSGLIW